MYCKYQSSKKFNVNRHQTKAHNSEKNNNNIKEKIEKKDVHLEKKDVHLEKTENILTCCKCDKIYKTEKSYKNHITICKGINSLTCGKCMRIFSNKDSKNKHIKKGNCIPKSIIHYDEYKPDTNIENYNNIQTQNNTINNIYINNYGHERIDYITYEYINEILLKGKQTIPLLIKKKHFNDDFPENKNISYRDDNKTYVRENDEWIEKDLQLLSSKLLSDNIRILLKYIKDHNEDVMEFIKDDEKYEYIKDKLYDVLNKSDMSRYNEIQRQTKDCI